MNLKRHILLTLGLASLFLTVLSASNIWAQIKEIEIRSDKELFNWPAEKRPRMYGRYTEVEIDGPLESRIVISSESRKFVFENEGRWIFSATTTPRYSIVMSDRLDPSLTFGIARFRKGEFLSTLGDENWNSYLESIRADVVPKNIVYLHYTALGRSAPYILKNWTRKVEYEYPLGTSDIGKTREIFSFIDDELFVFIFSGEKEAIDSLRESHNTFLTRMNMYEDS